MSSTSFESDSSSSGRRLYTQLWYSMLCMPKLQKKKKVCMYLGILYKGFYILRYLTQALYCNCSMYKKLYHNCVHNHLPEDEPLGSKHV